VAFTTVVASLATAPFAVFHFQRLPVLGVVANLVAVPLAAFWIMPAGLLVLILMPFGLDAPAVRLMGWGVEAMLRTAEIVAAWPGAAVGIVQPPVAALAAAVLGGLWLVLWRGRWRLYGLAGILLAVALTALHRPPDVLVSPTGQMVAVRQPDGSLALSPWRRDAWLAGRWLSAYGLDAASPWPDADGRAVQAMRCDVFGCVVSRDGRRVALVRRAEALAEDCGVADLAVSLVPYARCPRGPALDRLDLLRGQGVALSLAPGGVRAVTVRERRGERPWVR
jgi:competence protein ComEC